MATTKMSLKNLQELQRALGGTKKGYYITVYSGDIVSGKQINISQRIAVNVRKNASADYYLVKGTVSSRAKR